MTSEKSLPLGGFEEFESCARSILWRLNTGSREARKQYNKWLKCIADLKKNEGYGHREATIRVSKGFPSLRQSLREHDVSMYDTDDSMTDEPRKGVKSEGKEQSHRDNLNWAISAAGETLRTGKRPTVCPNDAAYYLFMQAIDEPKDFLSRFTQVENKSSDGDEDPRSARAVQRSVDELDRMLDALDEEE